MTRQQKIILISLICLPVITGIFLYVLENSGSFGNSVLSDIQNKKIGLVRVTDVIYSSENYVWQLNELRRDKTVGGVILRIESPGGAVSPSQEIYREVLRYREDNKPLIVSMGNMAASGGYYIACPAMKIFANPGTLTGSIGVIFRFPQYYRLFDKIGLKMETIKAGKNKDIGSPHHEMTHEERAVLQNLINDTHEQFINDILQARKFNPDSLRLIADGSVFTGRQALSLGLVDSLGGFEDALAYMKYYLGLSEKSKTLEKHQKAPFWNDMLIESAIKRFPAINSLRQPAGAYFLFESF
jgi:protease-4